MDDKTLMEIAGNMDKEKLLKLISFMISLSESARQVLVDYCQKNVTAGNNKQDAEKQLRQHWNKAQPVIEMFNTCGGGPKSDEDDVRDELNMMKDLLGKSEISWTARREVLDEILEEVASDNSGLTDILVDVAANMCKAKEEKIYLADFLADYGNSFYKNYASAIYLENSEQNKDPEDEKEQLVCGSDYLALANKYKKQGKQELALKTIQEGLEKAEGRLYEIYDYLFRHYASGKDEKALEDLYKKASNKERDKDFITELMYGYYKEQENYAKKKEMLCDLVSCADDRKLGKWYYTCQKELSSEDFAVEEKSVLETIKKRNLSAYFDICMEKGNVTEVLECLAERRQFLKGGVDAGHHFSKQLASGYPQEIAELYWKEVDFYIQLGEQENYSHAVDVLREIHEIMEKNSWTDEWNERYNEFIRDSIGNPLLIAELGKF